MKSNFNFSNPIQELRDSVNDLKRKNDNLTIIVVITSIIALIAIVAIVVYKSCTYKFNSNDFDDDFDYFDDDFEDDFEDIDESDFE